MARPFPLLTLQIALALGASGAAVAAPPAEGEILILSVTGQSAGEIAGWALDGQTRLLGRGPLATSLVIRGEGGRIAAIARAHGAVAVRGSAAMCAGEKQVTS